MNILQRLALATIAGYQKKGGGMTRFRVDCNFEPHCSDYAATAIRRFGFWRGLRLSIGRIRRCNVRDQVGVRVDEVPDCTAGNRVAKTRNEARNAEDNGRCHHV